MKDYILSVFSVVIIASIILMILPQNRISKVIKPLVSIVVLLVIINPVISFFKSSISTNISSDFDYKINLQYVYLLYSYDEKNNYNVQLCDNVLKNEEIEATTKIDYEITSKGEYLIKKVLINFSNLELNKDDKHKIKLENAMEKISEILLIDKGIIIVNE